MIVDRGFRRLCVGAWALVLAACPSPVAAQTAPTPDPPPSAPEPLPSSTEPTAVAGPDWALERVTLKEGKEYRGLVTSENPKSIEFVEVHRPRGKPMFLVVRQIERQAIERLERLDAADQETLRGRLERFKQRTLIEARRMEDLSLVPKPQGDKVTWQYEGDWFSLESTASESMTRRSIVRLEQIFTAYRQVLPPRWNAPARLRVQIFGADSQYQESLRALGLSINNPAVYLQDKNLILAGSNLNQFDAALAKVAAQHRAIREQLDTLVAETPSRSAKLLDELKKNQIPSGDRQKILAAEQKKWEEQRRVARRKIAALERANAEKFDVVAGQMFRRLAHEAFHAYLETFVYPRMAYDVPRWLNEGLAQTFEAGLLEAETLRIDMPNRVALERLQSDLAGNNPLGLADLLEAGSETFLAGHADDGQMVSRAYYYSWGLAYYLAFQQGALGTGDLETFLKPTPEDMTVVERFELFVGMSLAEFEPRWRAAMLGLQTTP